MKKLWAIYADEDTDWGEILIKLRLSRGHSASEASRAVGLSTGYISLLESGERPITVNVLSKYSKAYNISIEEIVNMEF